MDLTEKEAKGFWPVYEAYQADLDKINERIAKVINSKVINEYALAYNKRALMDKMARKLIDEASHIDVDEAKLKKSYVLKRSKVLPRVKVTLSSNREQDSSHRALRTRFCNSIGVLRYDGPRN